MQAVKLPGMGRLSRRWIAAALRRGADAAVGLASVCAASCAPPGVRVESCRGAIDVSPQSMTDASKHDAVPQPPPVRVRLEPTDRGVYASTSSLYWCIPTRRLTIRARRAVPAEPSPPPYPPGPRRRRDADRGAIRAPVSSS